jgi:hypothetical protein
MRCVRDEPRELLRALSDKAEGGWGRAKMVVGRSAAMMAAMLSFISSYCLFLGLE